MRCVNLDSFIDVLDCSDENITRSFIKISDHGYNFERDKGMSSCGCDALYSFVNRIVTKLSMPQKEGYIIGYTFELGVREEFDVLRFNNDFVLNVELKSKLPKRGYDGIREQLVRHQYLLSVLGKDVYVFTYVHDQDRLYSLDENEHLVPVDFDVLFNYITEDYVLGDCLESFTLDDLIISPYSEPQRFKEKRYFLSDEQLELKEQILGSAMKKICLSEGPGTGKTLLLVDIAKSYLSRGKRVVIVFGSKMNDSEAKEISEHLGFKAMPVKKPTDDISILNGYDVVLVDESHRIWKEVCIWRLAKFSEH